MAAKYRYSKKSGTWIKTKTECAYDYETADTESSAILIAFFKPSRIIFWTWLFPIPQILNLLFLKGLFSEPAPNLRTR